MKLRVCGQCLYANKYPVYTLPDACLVYSKNKAEKEMYLNEVKLFYLQRTRSSADFSCHPQTKQTAWCSQNVEGTGAETRMFP